MIAARFGCPVRVGGGTPDGAVRAARDLVALGAVGLVSFGLAGGLDPALRPGVLVIPRMVLWAGRRYDADVASAGRFGGLTGHCLLAGTAVAANVEAKRRLHRQTGAHAIDLESGGVAEVAAAHGIPFVAVRAICDPAERDLPPAALAALDGRGRIGLARVILSVLRHPGQVAELLRLASDAAAARRALAGLAAAFVSADGEAARHRSPR